MRLDVEASFLRDVWPSGLAYTGAGDVALGAWIEAWRLPERLDLSVGWRTKIPAARDEGQLGTDETDLALLGALAWTPGSARLWLGGGLAILGNPLQFANQDDVPVVWAGAALPAGPAWLSARVGGGLETRRNPARLSLDAGVETRGPWRTGVDASIGFTAAAADYGGGAHLGYAWGCPRGRGD